MTERQGIFCSADCWHCECVHVCVCICVQEVSVSSYTLLVLHWRDVKKLGRAEPSLAQLKSIVTSV